MNINIFRHFLDRRIHSYQSDLMAKHCDEVQNIYQQMRTMRHDYKNHLQVMKAYLELGEYDKLSAYISHLNQEVTDIDKVIKTGNVMLDAILNSKIAIAQNKNIEVNTKVLLPPAFSVSDYDLCTILGNLLDNAIEACAGQSEGQVRFLRIYIGLLKEQLYISVTNSYETKIQKKNGKFHSTKASARGFGLMSIDSIVKRNKGYVNRKYDESIFATEVLLPL